ncbi:MAG: hypothetical protein ACTHNB_13015 [Gaiellaceae bacterium]
MTKGPTGYLRVMQAADEVPLRPPAPWRAEAPTEIEKTRAHVAATWRFLDEMHLRMDSMQRHRTRTARTAS